MRGWRILLAVAAVCAGWLPSQAQRLPGGVIPQHYALIVVPDLSAANFTGSERIELTLTRPTRSITLNAAELTFIAVHAHLPGLPSQSFPAAVTLDENAQQATLTFERELPAGPATLEIAYSGKINSKLRGFYLSRSRTNNYGVTQFESTDARRAFPCFDEPALKATFSVSLVIDSSDTAISNTALISDSPGPVEGKHTVTFSETPRMSTYLLAWVVGEFECSRGKSEGVPIRVCSTPDKVRLTRFALDAAKWDLHYYNHYFGIRYPLAKLDLIAVPDFDSGAMENFGCILFRESELLVDQKNGTLPARKDVTTTVAHEIAHQWFGDLVTPAWWDNLWLNEGFATWMENKAAALQHPNWRFEEDAALDLDRAMEDDATSGTRAIRSRAETPAQIDSLFDEIAYDKAGAVIGMVEHWIGEERFRRGVQQYLSAHLYGNATAEDFWETQSRVSGLPVDRVMRSFIEQPGVPLLELHAAAGTAELSQTRFVQDAQPAPAETWTIPVCFAGFGCSILAPEATMSPPAAALYTNASQKGYYRTNYSPELLQKLSAGAESMLRPPERIGLLGDRWALMLAGRAPVGQVLDLGLAMKTDQDPAVLESVLEHLSAIAWNIASGEDRAQLQAVLRRELTPVYLNMGGYSEHEADPHAEVREALFEALGKAGDPAVLAQAGEISHQLLQGHKPADPNLADAAVVLSAPHGDAAMYDLLQHVSERTTEPDLRETAQRVLTSFESPALVARTLEYALSPEVRSQDSPTLIDMELTHPEMQQQAWKFLRDHWEEVLRKAPPDSGDRFIAATGSFCSVDQRQAVAEFFAAHPVEGAERTLRHALAQIDQCVRIRQTQQPLLHEWLQGMQHAGAQ